MSARFPYVPPTVDDESALFTGTTSNTKTGNVPTMAIGRTREESKRSCAGCPLLDSKDCYAQFGTPSFGHAAQVKSYAKLPEEEGQQKYSLRRALANRRMSARMVRLGSIGDPGALSHKFLSGVIDAIRSELAPVRSRDGSVRMEPLDPIGYTHHWRGRQDLAGMLMASVGSLDEADEAIDLGFRAAAVVPAEWKDDPTKQRIKTPEGNPAIMCPAIIQPDIVTCNTCRLCNGAKSGPVIMFPDHGPKARARARGNK